MALLDTIGAKGSLVDREHAKACIAPEVGAGRVLEHADAEDANMPALLAQLRERAATVNRGDLSEVKAMLTTQAVTLEGIFSHLAAKGLQAQDSRMMESYLRLALKAQSQCRTSLETLAEIVNPRPVYVRQQNVAAGHQQVNNGIERQHARELENGNAPSKLLEEQHGKWLDSRASGAAVRLNPAMATLGTIDRPENTQRQGNG